MSIFLNNAPLYWGAGIPVMPLKRWDSPGKGRGKAPILNEWTQYGDVMPSAAMRDLWLREFPDSNIGLPFGPASGLCAIDIDTEDKDVEKVILDLLPASPWKRVGRKGQALIYRWQGQANFKLASNEGMIVEFLGQGNQLVLPPSIHPDTEKPYTSNTHLWEVLDEIKPLPADIERQLRLALEPILGTKGLTLSAGKRSAPLDIVPQGERDVQMVKHAGYLARVVRGIDKNKRFTLAEAMQHMRHWVENFTASSAGDDMDPDKGVAKLLEFLLKDVEVGKTLPDGWDVGLDDAQREHPTIAALIEKNAIQRWTLTGAEAWLVEQLEGREDDVDYKASKVYELIGLLAKDENFGEHLFASFISTLQRLAKPVSLKVPDLKAYFRSERKGDAETAADHAEIARQVYDDLCRVGDVKFAQGKFWQWGGAHFKAMDEDEIYMAIADGVKGNTLARRHQDYLSITKTLQKIARGTLVEEMEIGVNFANGFLDARGVLHEHSPKFGKTFTLPFNYIPERAAEAHKWFAYLEMSWGDDLDYTEKVMALQEAFAATMFGIAPSYQRAILLHGRPKTGKTQALEVLKSMMPPEGRCSIPPTLWSERFQLANMVGKTLNVCGELPEEAVIDGRAFKEVVEGTGQHTEFKGKDAFEFDPIAAHWFGSNHLPRTRDTSGGFLRRWLILDFNRVVQDSERVINFHEVLIAEEREAIAAWAVQGLQRLMDQKDYTLPASHHKRINNVLRANNSVAAFLQSSEKVRPTEDSDADARSIFDLYVWFMKDVSKGYNVSFERFIQMLEELGYECEQKRDVLGVMRYRAKGLKILQTELPK